MDPTSAEDPTSGLSTSVDNEGTIAPTVDASDTGPNDATDEPEADDPLVRGQTVKVKGLVEGFELNGRVGRVIDDFVGDDDDFVFIRINKPFFSFERRMVCRRNVEVIDSSVERMVQVIWTYTRRLNTGQHGLFAEVMADAYAADNEEESSVRSILCTQSELFEFIEQMHFEKELDMRELKRLGLQLHGFAFNAGAEESGKGKDNVIANRMCGDSTSVIGTAFFARVDKSNGRMVDFSFDEAMRTFMFLNDADGVKKELPNKMLTDATWETLVKCFPFYDIGCRLTAQGFFGLKSMIRSPDGEFTLEPPDMKPVDSFVLAGEEEEDDDDGPIDTQLLTN